jgi:selenocysteine lyase/cysteine desulfurase
VSPEDIASAVMGNTRIVVMTHASNVLGSIQPIRQTGEICRERNVLLLVDAAQTLGAVPVDIEADCIDLLAFAGHKSLYGPQGTGGLIVGDRVDVSSMEPVICGGTGSRSESENQPDFLPDMLEAGTVNGPGIAGLSAGVDFLLSIGIESIRQREMALTERLIHGLLGIPRVTDYGPTDPDRRVAVVSFNIEGVDPAVAAMQLDERFGIMCRAGLHCAPAAHRTAGTFPMGSVRFSMSWFTCEADVDAALHAVEELAK